MPNYYDMSGEAASASAQQTTGAENGPTADAVGATTTGAGAEQDNDVQRLHRYKLPPPFFTGDYSQYEEWLFKLQAYLGLLDHYILITSRNKKRWLPYQTTGTYIQ